MINRNNLKFNKQNQSEIYRELIVYKQLLIDAKFAYRINPTDMALRSLHMMQGLHDNELARVRQLLSPKPKHIKVSNEINFEKALQTVFG